MSAPPTPTAPLLVEVDRVSRWYGDVLAVNEVSATFGPGVTGLLGPNGAGKSTLLKVITGMMAPSLGRVTIGGDEPFDHPAVMRRVGLVPEQDAVYAGTTALEMLVYLTRLHGYPREVATTLARRALERVGLGEAMNRSVGGYSKGMRQRVKVAQALAHHPDVVILDEPMNGLDPVARRDMTSLIHALGDEGRVVIVSSHVLHEVEAMTSRVLLMSYGRVVAEGTVEDLRRELSDHPRIVRVECERARELAARLVVLDGVQRIALTATGLEVLTVRPATCFLALAAATHEGAPVAGWRPLDEGLEAVFRYLTDA